MSRFNLPPSSPRSSPHRARPGRRTSGGRHDAPGTPGPRAPRATPPSRGGRVAGTSPRRPVPSAVSSAVATAAAVAGLLGSLLAPAAAEAQGWIDPVRPGSGSVERVESRIHVTVEGTVATVEVDEWFVNRGDRVAEGHYLYPLPAGAALAGASLYQGETELRGEVIDADEARRIYEEIVRRRADPALIEYMGEGLFRARVFPIEAGERRRITLRYSQVLEPAGSSLHYRSPGALRQGRPTATGPEPGRPAPRIGASAPVSLQMVVTPSSAFLDPFSPSHALEVERRADTLRAGVPEAEGRISLFLPRSSDLVGLSVLPHRPAGEEGYVLLSLTPPATTAEAEPRDVVVVVDVSGSMAGEKMAQARAAVGGLLSGLRPGDRFRLVSFSNGIHRLDTEWRRAEGADLDDARRWVDALRADGGTNIDGALAAAFETPPAPDRLPVVVFLTDGLPTVGEQDRDRITAAAEARRGRYRVFAFGVGHDVDTRLLDRLSEATRGTTQYVEPGEDVERAVSLLGRRIAHPVLTDLRLVDAPVDIRAWYPVQIPDVFAGETLVLLARYRGEGEGAVVVEGRHGGAVHRISTRAVFPAVERAHAGLPRLWAARKIGHLTRQLWTEGRSEALVEEIRATALRYGLPSPYTSILVQEPGVRVANGPLPGPARSAAALPPAAQANAAAGAATGAEAVRLAERSRRFRDADRVDELEALVSPAAEADDGGRRLLAGRVLELQDGVWTEVGLDATVPRIRIQRFSAAWFELVEALPGLEAAFRAGPIEIMGVGLRLAVGDDGLESLDDATRRRVMRAFGPDA